MFKNQKFLISWLLMLSLGFVQEVCAPADGGMFGTEEELMPSASELRENNDRVLTMEERETLARNYARENAENLEKNRVSDFKKKSLFYQAKDLKSGKVTFAEARSGKPDPLKVNQVRKEAALNLFENRHPGDLHSWDLADKPKKVASVLEAKESQEAKEAQEKYLKNLPHNISDLDLSMLEKKMHLEIIS